MLRGRHRGLPVALDRAVMLPHEFRLRKPDREQHQQTQLSQQHVTEDPGFSGTVSESKDEAMSAGSHDIVLRQSSKEEEEIK